jgi:AcrR family transcriptional regulator
MSSTADPETDGRALRGQATRRRIVDAAREVLLDSGHGGTSTRAVADRANVRLSLVHYHFGGKQGLLAEVLDRENELLLARQRRLFDGPEPLAEKWRIACDLLDEDVGSGYVRVLWELWAAGLADAELAARWRTAMGGWRALLESVCERWVAEHGLELPLRPKAIASLIANLFQGIEIELLAGVSGEEAPHREVLDAIGALIERAEAR